MILSGKYALSILLISLPVWAAKPAEVEYSLLEVFAKEGALYVEYSIGDDGKVIVLFGKNEPDWRIAKTVQALQSRPDIPGISWVKTDAEYCAIR